MRASTLSLLVLSTGLILLCLVISWVIVLTFRLSQRIGKKPRIKTGSLFLVSLLQVLAGFSTVVIARLIKNDPLIDLAAGFLVLILAGLPLAGICLKDWKRGAGLWATAAGFQVILVPVCAAATAFLIAAVILVLFPPVYQSLPSFVRLLTAS